MSQKAFTLVELSIVLVILGLLVGGVLTGQSLIRAAELRAVTSEYQRYQTASNAFRDKYFALPGDMTNASLFWTSLSTSNNGNGDGVLMVALSNGATSEIFQFWNMLSLAGVIEGKYTGISGSGGTNESILGSNAPKSKLSAGGWGIGSSVYWGTSSSGDVATYVASYDNTLVFGSFAATAVNYNGILKPEEAWNIDTKIDDGKPGTGKLLARDTATWSGSPSIKCTTSVSNIDYAGFYNLSSSAVVCALFFKLI